MIKKVGKNKSLIWITAKIERVLLKLPTKFHDNGFITLSNPDEKQTRMKT